MTDIEIDGHIQDDPVLNLQAETYSTLGGDLPAKIFLNFSNGFDVNNFLGELIDGDNRWSEGNLQSFEHQARDILGELDEINMIQSEPQGWNLTSYGKQWQEHMASADRTLRSLIDDGEIASPEFGGEAGQLIYRGEETVGEIYRALGFNMGAEATPEALPALYILAEGVNDSVVPADYVDGVEMLELVGMVTDVDYTGEDEDAEIPGAGQRGYEGYEGGDLEPEITEVGQRIYDEVVVEDNEFLQDFFYGFD